MPDSLATELQRNRFLGQIDQQNVFYADGVIPSVQGVVSCTVLFHLYVPVHISEMDRRGSKPVHISEQYT